MDMRVGVSLVLLMAAFAIISVYYFRRQATALEYMAHVEETRFMRQQQIWRREDSANVDVGQPVGWLAEVAGSALGEPITLSTTRVIGGLPAVEAIAAGGGRIVFSTLGPRDLKRMDGRVPDDRSDPGHRIRRMAAEEPLLGRRPRRVRSGQCSLMHDEWFDVKAGKVGRALGVAWGEPPRLWVYRIAPAS